MRSIGLNSILGRQVIDGNKFYEESRIEVCGTSEDPRPFYKKFHENCGIKDCRKLGAHWAVLRFSEGG